MHVHCPLSILPMVNAANNAVRTQAFERRALNSAHPPTKHIQIIAHVEEREREREKDAPKPSELELFRPSQPAMFVHV
jgi:hypothetical protein